MDTTSKNQRPLSPFLTVYRWQYTMALSILHRITGCVLSVSLLLFVYWLGAAASGADAYRRALDVFANPLIKAVLFALSFAFFYHLLNGARHLAWDTGHGLERQSARMSGWAVFIGSLLLTVFFWALLLVRLRAGVP